VNRELGVIFDLDGVVIDVTSTYRQAYVDGVMDALRHDAGLLVDTPLFSVEDVHALKRNPGYNAPRDTVDFFVDACLTIAACDAKIRHSKAYLTNWHRDPANAVLDDDARAWIAATRPQLQALRRCHEAYVGSSATQRIYGVPPLSNLAGHCGNDRLLLDPTRIIDKPIAVYTGRNSGEARLVLDRFALFANMPANLVFTTDDGAWKPDPAPIGTLIERLGCQRALYIGDTAADRETIRRYNAGSPEVRCQIAQVMSGTEKAPWDEAIAVAQSCDDLLDRLGW